MRWITIKYKCGHSSREGIYGTLDQIQATADQKTNSVCRECKKKLTGYVWQKTPGISGSQAIRDNLPPIEGGTEKQIAWAMTIRKDALASPLNALPDSPTKDHMELEYRARTSVFRKRLETEKSCTWWITNRDIVPDYVKQLSDQLRKHERIPF